MRDDHRPKHELIHEITGLRKQVVDLKDAMVERRRVEDALRATESLLRSLADRAPVGLCLFRRDGTPLTANNPFARMLGYDSASELQRIGRVLGVFASPEERSRVLGTTVNGDHTADCATFRTKDGGRRRLQLLAADCGEPDTVALVVIDGLPPFPPHAA
jgi:PAS domain S-box-containing protein